MLAMPAKPLVDDSNEETNNNTRAAPGVSISQSAAAAQGCLCGRPSHRWIYRPSKALASPESWLLQWAWLHRCAAPTACSGHAVSFLSGRSGWLIRRQYMRINHGSHLYFCCNFSPGAWRAGVRALVLDFPGSMAGTATGCGVGAPARMAAVDTISLCNTSESLELQQLQQLAARTPQPPLPPCLIAL